MTPEGMAEWTRGMPLSVGDIVYAERCRSSWKIWQDRIKQRKWDVPTTTMTAYQCTVTGCVLDDKHD